MTIWEYKIETVTGIRQRPGGKAWKVKRTCDDLGEQGWELVSVTYSWLLLAHVLYFKRPKQTRP